MHRIDYLSQLKELSEEEPGSLRYNNVLKVKRNYVYDSWKNCEYLANEERHNNVAVL